MFGKLDIFQIAGGLAKHAAARQARIATNIANADTPGYRARDIKPFNVSYQPGHGADGLRASRPGHDLSATPGKTSIETVLRTSSAAPDGNSVSIETEMVEAINTKRKHEMALTVYQTSLGILRSSLRTTR